MMKQIITNKYNLTDADMTEVVKRVKVLLVNSNNEVLLGYSHNNYQFPGGHVEENETLIQTVNREVLEETGIEIEIVSNQKHEISYKPKMNIQKKVLFFEAKKVGGILKNQESEIQAVEWVQIEKVFEKLTYEKSRIEFQKFMKEKKKID